MWRPIAGHPQSNLNHRRQGEPLKTSVPRITAIVQVSTRVGTGRVQCNAAPAASDTTPSMQARKLPTRGTPGSPSAGVDQSGEAIAQEDHNGRNKITVAARTRDQQRRCRPMPALFCDVPHSCRRSGRRPSPPARTAASSQVEPSVNCTSGGRSTATEPETSPVTTTVQHPRNKPRSRIADHGTASHAPVTGTVP